MALQEWSADVQLLSDLTDSTYGPMGTEAGHRD
jgi:hypothetical protein